MSCEIDLDGKFKFSKELLEEFKKKLAELNKGFELGKDRYVEIFGNKRIYAEWCPWRYDESENALVPVDGIAELSHNRYFIDWLAWIIESICVPANSMLSGSCEWENTDYDGDDCGSVVISDGIIKVNGRFLEAGHDYYAAYRRSNRLVKRMKEKT